MPVIAGKVNNNERWVSPGKAEHLLVCVVGRAIVNEDDFGGLSQRIRNRSDPPVHFRKDCSFVITGNDKTDIWTNFGFGPQPVACRKRVHAILASPTSGIEPLRGAAARAR